MSRISFDLEEFKTWLEDLDYDWSHSNSRWDFIRDRYEVDEGVRVLCISEWGQDKKGVILSETEVVLVGKMV